MGLNVAYNGKLHADTTANFDICVSHLYIYICIRICIIAFNPIGMRSSFMAMELTKIVMTRHRLRHIRVDYVVHIPCVSFVSRGMDSDNALNWRVSCIQYTMYV